jgi:hypothetical protein
MAEQRNDNGGPLLPEEADGVGEDLLHRVTFGAQLVQPAPARRTREGLVADAGRQLLDELDLRAQDGLPVEVLDEEEVHQAALPGPVGDALESAQLHPHPVESVAEEADDLAGGQARHEGEPGLERGELLDRRREQLRQQSSNSSRPAGVIA